MREGWKRGGWKRCESGVEGCIMTPMPNHLSTRLTTHLLMSGGVWGTHSKNKKATQNSVEKVAM